jgi:archaellum component FlaG (FlaF/FlaG flagellin family)
MTTTNTTQTSVNASYVMNPAKAGIKVVVTRKNENENKVQVKTKTRFVKRYYSIDTNGGGYTGL